MHRAILNILIHTISTFSIFSYIDNIYLRIFRSNQFSNFLRIRHLFILRYRIYLANSFTYHSVRMTISIFANLAFSIFAFDFLSFSFALCDHVFDDHSMTQNLKTLYSMHLIENVKILRCNWFTQAKRTQKNYHLRKHELKIKNKLKEKMKQLTKQKEKTRLIKKRIEKYTCRRCKHSIKFDNNIKFHEHIRIRHAKKSKTIVSFFLQISKSIVLFFIFFVSSFHSITSSSVTSSKFLLFSMLASEIVRERSENVSFFSSIETSKKSIFWAEIVSRLVIASKLFRLSIATSKSIYNILKKFAVCCSFISSISSRAFTLSRLYFIVNDLFRMFVEKSNSFDLQSSQKKSLFSRNLDKCSFKNNCKFDFIQIRITSYFNAMILFAFKLIKFETFASTHDSIKQSIRTSFFLFRFIFRFASMRFFFSTLFRSFSVCRHCQKRFVIYWFTDWVMRNVSKIENNEIFKRQRYWSFASSRFTLKKYWFLLERVTILKKYWSLLEKVTTLKKLTCCLFCSLAFSINRWSI